MSPKVNKNLPVPTLSLSSLDSIAKINPLLRQSWGGIIQNTLNTALLLAHARRLFNLQTQERRGRPRKSPSADHDVGDVRFVEWITQEHSHIGLDKAKKLCAMGESHEQLTKMITYLPPEWSKMYIISTFNAEQRRLWIKQEKYKEDMTVAQMRTWSTDTLGDVDLSTSKDDEDLIRFAQIKVRDMTYEEQGHLKRDLEHLKKKYHDRVHVEMRKDNIETLKSIKTKIEQDIQERLKIFKKTCKLSVEKQKLIEDVWRRIRTETYDTPKSDGSFRVSDIRCPDHEFHWVILRWQTKNNQRIPYKFKIGLLKSYCRTHGVVCPDCPLEDIDEEQRINVNYRKQWIELMLKKKQKLAQKVVTKLSQEISQSRFTKTKKFALTALDEMGYEFPQDSEKRYVSTIASMNRQSPKQRSTK